MKPKKVKEPKEKVIRKCYSLPKEDIDFLEQHSLTTDRSRSAIIKLALRDYKAKVLGQEQKEEVKPNA